MGLEVVTLARDFPAEALFAGAVGTIVHVHRDSGPYEVEFTRPDGTTIEAERCGLTCLDL